jgi:hypothetical protein
VLVAVAVIDYGLYEADRAALAERLEAWMRETDDPLLAGDVEPPPGTEITDPDQVSPSDVPIAHR